MKKLAVIGASYLQKPLLLKAKEMKIETHCFAWEEGAVCKNIADFFYPISITEKDSILDKCKEIGIDGITSIASDLASPTMCYVAEKMGLISNSYSVAVVAANKYKMRKCFVDNQVNSPRFILANENYSLENFKFPLIVKPTDRSGSRGVLKINHQEEVEQAVKRAQKESFTGEVIIEEFITGAEVSVETISWKGEHYILAITDKVTSGEPYFVELEHHQPSMLPSEIQLKIKNLTIKALKALNITYGASHSEFKITEKGDVFAIEVGARMGGGFIGSDLVQLSTGYDFLKGVIELSLGKFNEPVLDERKNSGIYFLTKETEKIKQYIEQSAFYPEIVKAEITDSKIRPAQSSADRNGYFIYQSNKRMTI